MASRNPADSQHLASSPDAADIDRPQLVVCSVDEDRDRSPDVRNRATRSPPDRTRAMTVWARTTWEE